MLRHEESAYWLFDLVTNKARKRPVHVSRLVPFRYNPNYTNPREVASKDVEEFVVSEVIDHRFQINKKNQRKLGSMELLVKWLGYGPEWDSWEPWANLRNVKATHRYLAKVGLERHIPQQFRRDNYEIDTSSEDENEADALDEKDED